LNYPGPTGGVNWGSAAIDPNTGILYANTNRLASVTRLVPRRRAEYERIEENIDRRWLSPYLPRKKFWAEVFVTVFLLASVQRRRFNPGWAPAIVVIIGAGFIGGYRLHASQVRPAAMNWIDHFGNELSPQRKSPYLIERHPLVDSQGFSYTPAPWGALRRLILTH
jgi:quinoprotein glucose dehydrogenase